MVRYSKLAFRQTVHDYGTDLCWTPMILAKEFNRNSFARDSGEFFFFFFFFPQEA
jgi:tRNA-dihydrouridine synthase 4